MLVAFGEVREPACTQDPVAVGGSLGQDPHRRGEELLGVPDPVTCTAAFWRKLQGFQSCTALHRPLQVSQDQRATPGHTKWRYLEVVLLLIDVSGACVYL